MRYKRGYINMPRRHGLRYHLALLELYNFYINQGEIMQKAILVTDDTIETIRKSAKRFREVPLEDHVKTMTDPVLVGSYIELGDENDLHSYVIIPGQQFQDTYEILEPAEDEEQGDISEEFVKVKRS